MQLKTYIKHALTMLRREFGCGEYRLTLFALLIGVAAVTALSLTTSRIQNAMLGQAADLIGGDIVISSSTAIDDDIRSLASEYRLKQSLSIGTLTMASKGDVFLLTSLRAVDDAYPLKGSISTRASMTADLVDGIIRPQTGEGWAEKRLLDRLNIKLGDEIEIGYSKIKINRLLEMEPDRGSDFYSLNPRLMINLADLEKTQIIQSASRLRYKLMLSGNPQNIAQFTDAVKNKLDASQRLQDPLSSENRVSDNLDRAGAFLNIGALLSVILCGIAVSLAVSRHTRRHINQVALLRCFGLRARDVNWIYTLQLVLLTIPAIILGMVIAYFLHALLIKLLSDFFQASLPAAPLIAWLSGPITAMCMVLGFGLPPLLRLAQTPPARVFRNEYGAAQHSPIFSVAIALVALSIVAWWQTDNLKLAVFSVAGTLGVVMTLALAILALLRFLQPASITQPILRSAVSSLKTRPALAAMQVAGFGVSLFAITLIIFFRNDIFDQWNAQVPPDAPNRFVFDILQSDRAEFSNLLAQHEIKADLYSTVRGRLVKINGEIVQRAVSKDKNQSDEALNRDLSLTQFPKLPYENELISGEFIGELAQNHSKLVPVSVESDLAEELNINIGDQLEFLVEGRTITASITSLRSVNWENFRPNFYMIFPMKTLDDFAQSTLTSFYLPEEKASLERTINQNFTGATLIDVDFILSRIRRILKQVSSAIELTFALAVVAGLAVFWAALLISFDEKQYQAALLRALGASRRNVSLRFITEQLIIGLLAGVLASLCLLLVSYLISTRVLDLAWEVPWLYALGLPVLMMTLLAALGSLQLKGILNRAPYQVLKQAQER